MGKADQPKYEVLESYEDIELRSYESMLIAEVCVCGARKEAIRNGFKVLADYIFGNNKPPKNALASHSKGEKIAMTAPVMQEEYGPDWKIRFAMPNHYRYETLPKPNRSDIKIIEIPAKQFAVVRFSGLATDEKIRLRSLELQNFISAMRWLPLGQPILAFYDPPWTLPFLRRNEIMIEVERI